MLLINTPIDIFKRSRKSWLYDHWWATLAKCRWVLTMILHPAVTTHHGR